MALFGKKKKEGGSAAPRVVTRDISSVIVRPVVTEKAARLGGEDVYAFFVSKGATKHDVRDAVQKLWNVTPKKVRMVVRQPRAVFLRSKNRTTTASGAKKAYVHLKKGDRIDLV